MRHLTLANLLRGSGAECQFICAPLDGPLPDEFQANGRNLAGIRSGEDIAKIGALPTQSIVAFDAKMTPRQFKRRQPDWLVIDHDGLMALQRENAS